MPVSELVERISYDELIEWIAYYQLEPFGPAIDHLGPAITSSVVANANRDPKKRKKAYSPFDFLVTVDKRSKEIDGEKTKGALEKLRLSMAKN